MLSNYIAIVKANVVDATGTTVNIKFLGFEFIFDPEKNKGARFEHEIVFTQALDVFKKSALWQSLPVLLGDDCSFEVIFVYKKINSVVNHSVLCRWVDEGELLLGNHSLNPLRLRYEVSLKSLNNQTLSTNTSVAPKTKKRASKLLPIDTVIQQFEAHYKSSYYWRNTNQIPLITTIARNLDKAGFGVSKFWHSGKYRLIVPDGLTKSQVVDMISNVVGNDNLMSISFAGTTNVYVKIKY